MDNAVPNGTASGYAGNGPNTVKDHIMRGTKERDEPREKRDRTREQDERRSKTREKGKGERARDGGTREKRRDEGKVGARGEQKNK